MWRHSYNVQLISLPRFNTVTLSFHIMSCLVIYILRVPVKITVHVLAAGCQSSYHKFYGFFAVLTFFQQTVKSNSCASSVSYSCLDKSFSLLQIMS